MDQEQEDYVDLSEDAEVVEQAPKAKVKKPAQAKVQVEKEVVAPEERYVAYHAEEVKGIVDKETNKLLPDLDSQNAEILNKLDNIEKSTG